jgi:hypothetical protein
VLVHLEILGEQDVRAWAFVQVSCEIVFVSLGEEVVFLYGVKYPK